MYCINKWPGWADQYRLDKQIDLNPNKQKIKTVTVNLYNSITRLINEYLN